MKMLFHPETKAAELCGCSEEVQHFLSKGYLLKQPGLAEGVAQAEVREQKVKKSLRQNPNDMKSPGSERINPLRESKEI